MDRSMGMAVLIRTLVASVFLFFGFLGTRYPAHK